MIYKKELFKEIFLLSSIIAILHYYATVHSLYWSISWFDILMHFLGGLLMGFIGIFLVFVLGRKIFPEGGNIFRLLITVGFVLLVGMSWELWELFTGLASVFNDLGDTILDLIMDTAGAIVAYLIAIKKIWIKN